jgi:hypothetical protein
LTIKTKGKNWKSMTMEATKATEQSQSVRSRHEMKRSDDLDDRYGKIGISAVAAAVRHTGVTRRPHAGRHAPYDRD